MYGLALILVIIVMGGAIAYIGDKLGTKVGKRKMSLFNLRPKHTSIIVTIVTGILIASSTLGIMTLISQDVRTALFGMKALKAELDNLSQEVQTKNNDLAQSKQSLIAKNKELTDLTTQIVDTAKQLEEIDKQLGIVTSERDKAAQSLVEAQGDITELAKVKTELDKKVSELDEAKNSLEYDVNRLNQLTINLKKGMEHVRESTVVFRAGEVLSTAVLDGGMGSDATAQTLRKVLYDTNKELAYRLGYKEPIELLWLARAEYEQAVNAISSQQERVIVRVVADANTVYGEPAIATIEIYPNKEIYKDGQIIYTKTVEAPKSIAQAEEIMIRFLQQVNSDAIKQGVLPDPLQGTVGTMSGSKLYSAVNELKGYTGTIKIEAIAENDIYSSGPLKIEFKIRPTKEAYI